MTAAQYTRDTLTRIRNGATAEQLGWDEKRYLEVCHKHQIAPVRPPLPKVDVLVAPPIAPTPVAVPLSSCRYRQHSVAHSFSVSVELHSKICGAAGKAGLAATGWIREAMQAAAASDELLPKFLRGDSSGACCVVSLTPGELAAFEKVATLRGLALNKFIRGACAAALKRNAVSR